MEAGDIRIRFHHETGKYAIKHKLDYTHWLEQKLLKELYNQKQ